MAFVAERMRRVLALSHSGCGACGSLEASYGRLRIALIALFNANAGRSSPERRLELPMFAEPI